MPNIFNYQGDVPCQVEDTYNMVFSGCFKNSHLSFDSTLQWPLA